MVYRLIHWFVVVRQSSYVQSVIGCSGWEIWDRVCVYMSDQCTYVIFLTEEKVGSPEEGHSENGAVMDEC